MAIVASTTGAPIHRGAPTRLRSSRRRFAAGFGVLAVAVGLGCGGGSPEVTVVMTEFAFEPVQIAIQAGQRTTVTLQNKGSVEHNFTVRQVSVVSPNVAPGQTAKIEIAAPRGTYPLVCTVPGHEEAGMVGQVTAARR